LSETPGQPPAAEALPALCAIAASIAGSGDPEAGLAAALESVVAALDLHSAAIHLVSETTDTLDSSAFRCVGEDGATPLAATGGATLREALEAGTSMAADGRALAPLRARGRVVGLLVLSGPLPRLAGAALREWLDGLGAILGAAVELARLLRRDGRHAAEVQALWEVNRTILDDHDLASVLNVVAREAGVLAGGDSAIALLESDKLRIAAAHGPGAVQALGEPPELAGQPLAALLDQVEPRGLPLEPQGEARTSALVVPLRAAGRTLGGLIVVRPDTRARPADLSVLAAVGHQAAVAVARARGREAERRRGAQLALVSGASEVAASTLDVDALLGAIARYIQRAFGYYSVTVYLVDREERQAMLAGGAGAALLMPRDHRVRFGSGIIGWVAERGEPVLANDVRHEPRFLPAPTEATRAELAVPVRLAGEVVAVINVESDRAGAFDDGDVLAVDGIASQVASAVRNARLFEEKVQALRSLEILQEITTVLNSDLDLDALLDRIARRSVEAVPRAHMGAVLLFEDGGLRVRSSFGYPDAAALAAVRLAFHEGLAGDVFVSGQGRVTAASGSDHGGHEAAFRRAAGGMTLRSALCVPISLPHEKLGVVLLENFSAPDAFDAGDLRFAGTLADQAAIAMGNALQLRRILDLDRQRQDYLSNVSHELRTPLTVVQGYLEAIVEGTASGQAEHFLRVAVDQCQRLARMIDEVLEVSRLEQGVAQKHLRWKSVDLGDTVRRVTRTLRGEAAGKAVRLVERLPADLPPVWGDDRLLRLLVLNLVENAVKFTPGGGSVEVGLEARGNEMALRVSDTGIGIPHEHQGRIFDKFFTVEAGPSRSHPGAGMGLYLVREVIEIHRGRIEVESRPGSGARFEVVLPLKPASLKEIPAAASVPLSGSPGGAG
jgi:signal transduction histidine kinase